MTTVQKKQRTTLLNICFIVLIIGSFAYNTGGYYFHFNLLRYRIRQEFKKEVLRGIPPDQLVVVEHTRTQHPDFKWQIVGKEFSWKGELYDVVNTSVEGKITIYHCLKDRKEKALIAHFQHSHRSRNRLNQKVRKIFNFQFSMVECVVVKEPYNCHCHFAEPPQNYRRGKPVPASPPPRDASSFI